MKDTLKHTYSPNTFGLLFGKTTTTACGKRRAVSEVVRPHLTDCPGCQDAVIADMQTMQGIVNAVHDLRERGLIPDEADEALYEITCCDPNLQILVFMGKVTECPTCHSQFIATTNREFL